MTAAVEHFLESHPDAAAAWCPSAARIVGRVLTLPGFGGWLPLARRVNAVAQPPGWTTVRARPHSDPPAACRGFTILTANLWHDWPRQDRWPARLEMVAHLIESEAVDIVLLQEVARTGNLHADGWLAERLGLALAYARTNGSVDAIGFEEGLAILSRFPISDVHLRQLSRSRNPLARRAALGADLATPLGRVLAVSTHLGLVGRHNAEQTRALRAWVQEVADDDAAVVGGDFNAQEHAAEMVRTRGVWTDAFRSCHPGATSSTHVSVQPWSRLTSPRVLDYVFVKQQEHRAWSVVSAAHVDSPNGPHSDHRAVLARIRPVDP